MLLPLAAKPRVAAQAVRRLYAMAFRWLRVRVPVHGCSNSCDLWPEFDRAIRGAHGLLPCVGWGVTASQFDLPSPSSLSVAGCSLLQLGAPHWATSVALLQVVDN